jgi:hypothetical protein
MEHLNLRIGTEEAMKETLDDIYNKGDLNKLQTITEALLGVIPILCIAQEAIRTKDDTCFDLRLQIFGKI